ncbi:efflux RND transporter permease subunit [Hoeflea sp. TYP-13]|uniref:efflux RND transporter permease subunit n=1 Tax=Hoeflea sp. TYP-13 TaxID=3230023 RepID=UPI0034C66AB0
MTLPAYFIDRPKFAIVIAILTALAGAIGIRFIPIAQFPDIVPPQVYVTASYPGANAALIQEAIATPIEEKVNGVDGMIYMSSSSSNSGTYELTVTFEIGTDPDIAAINVQNRVSLAEPILPAPVIQQGVVTSKQSGDMVMVLNLISPNGTKDALFLSNYAANILQDPLSRVSGVGAVNQFGSLNYSMRVWIQPDRMAALNIDASDISTAIENQNVEAAAGQVGAPPFGDQTTDFQFTLEADGLLKTVKEFENIIVSANTDGSVVRLSDVARIELGSETYDSSAKYNNKPSAAIAVYQESGANALDVADAVYAQMDELATKFPDDVTYELSMDVTTAVRVSIEEILFTLMITTALVIGVTFFFLLSWRATIIPAVAIPVSLLGAMALLYLFGFSANMITLFAIVLAITLVVDDAIVIIENAERIMEEEGLEAREATLKAMDQVTRPIIATTFVLAAVFVPVCFFPGVTGKLYLQFALTIIFAFGISAINALTLGPALCSMLLKRGAGTPKSFLRVIPATMDRVRNLYVRLVGLMLRYMIVSLAVFALFVAATVVLFQTTPTGFIPQEDNGILLGSVELPDGASLSRTEAVMSNVSEIVSATPGVRSVITISGFSMMAGQKPSIGMVIILLDPWSERKTEQTQWYAIMADLSKKLAALPEATSFVFPMPSIHGVGSSGGISAQLLDFSNGKVEDLDAAKKALVTALNAAPQFGQTYSNFSASSPQYYLAIDRDRAETLGVDVSDIFTALQANLSSLYVNNFIKAGRVYWVVISADAQFRQTTEDIDNIYVKNADGDSLPLRVLVSKSPKLGPQTIYRYNLFQTASVSGQLNDGVSSGQAITAMQEIANKTLPEDYGIEWTGVTLQEVEAGGLVLYIFLLAIVFAYLFLVAQYESWTLPMSVMASTVFAVFGAFIPLQVVPGLSNDIYAQIGIVLLIGLAAKKAIMVVEFAKVRREQGASIHHAALSAAKLRFRPVTMTGLCFIIGVLPLILSSGAGAAGRISIGFPVFAGMIIDSTIGLLMIPVLYAAFQTMREKARHLVQGREAAAK